MFCSCNGLNVLIVLNVLLTYLDTSNYALHLSDLSNSIEVPTRFRRQISPCTGYSFQCDSGQCILGDKQCDGVKDCSDGSDETSRCQEINNCPDYSYRCAYGACVDGDAKCNGKKECADNSDEANCMNNFLSHCGNKFSCKNGQCIESYLLCDGEPHCSDGSDETYASCNSIPCPDFAYVCAYGACVDGEAKCNGRKECADGSDEAPTLCLRPITPLSAGNCTLPTQLENGNYSLLFDTTVSLTAGQSVNDGTVIGFDCKTNYQLYPPNSKSSICLNGSWVPDFPSCLRTCPPRVSSSVQTDCELDGISVDCSKPLIEGTRVTMKCKHLFEPLIHSSRNTVRQCKDGTWDYPFLQCIPVCGEVIPHAIPLIIGGENAKMGDFPWHVGIYRKKPNQTKIEYKCGGSLINTKLVLSAAHCFTELPNGNPFPAQEYYIGAGKYYIDYDNKQDKLAQKIQVKEIIPHSTYRGALSNYAYDIAIVILEIPVTITRVVQPVCIDWENDFEDSQLIPGNKGQVVGWGYTMEGGNPSTELKKLEVPYIDNSQCLNVVPHDFYVFLTPDKFCAGLTTGHSVCSGDSGGGLVFLKRENRKAKWYIRGVVSVGPKTEGHCDSRKYATYTTLSKYMEFIRNIEKTTRD